MWKIVEYVHGKNYSKVVRMLTSEESKNKSFQVENVALTVRTYPLLRNKPVLGDGVFNDTGKT